MPASSGERTRAKELRYSRGHNRLRIGEIEIPRRVGYSPGGFDAEAGELDDVRLSAVRRALRSAVPVDGYPYDPALPDMTELELSIHPRDDSLSQTTVNLALMKSGTFCAEAIIGYEDSSDDDGDESTAAPAVEELVRRYCRDQKLELIELFSYWYRKHGAYIFHARIAIRRPGATVGDAVQALSSLTEKCDLFLSNDQSVEAFTRAALEAGRPDLLIGSYESRSLECKSQDFDLDDAAQRIELAQDVARFANSEVGGTLVLGLKTKKDLDGDRIVSVRPLGEMRKTARYHTVIDRLVYPPIDGLTVDALPSVPGGDLNIVALHVPAQNEELKPFLVTGAIVNGRVEGAFISIVRRRGEHSIPVTAAAIHSSLAAGRALLRFGIVPQGDGSTNSNGRRSSR